MVKRKAKQAEEVQLRKKKTVPRTTKAARLAMYVSVSILVYTNSGLTPQYTVTGRT